VITKTIPAARLIVRPSHRQLSAQFYEARPSIRRRNPVTIGMCERHLSESLGGRAVWTQFWTQPPWYGPKRGGRNLEPRTVNP
jgi:hypothetical protein